MLSSLSMRLFGLTAVVTLVVLSWLAWAVVRLHTANLEHETVQGALRLSDTLRRSARHSMLEDRKNDVYEMMQYVGAQPGIERLRIFNSEGLIVFSSIPEEPGKTVDQEEEACTRCHKEGEPVSHPDERELTRTVDEVQGTRVTITPELLPAGGSPGEPPGAPSQSPSPQVASWPVKYLAAICTWTRSS